MNQGNREKAILCGLLLSKFGQTALRALGFSSFVEAFNALGTALNTKPASIKGYRDELDPLFPNQRVGWNKRELRRHCREVYEEHGGRSLNELTSIIGGYLDPEFGLSPVPLEGLSEDDGDSSFARRLITGRAAESFFEENHHHHPEFAGGALVNTTRFGCGFDYRINFENRPFFAVEVKGLREARGTIQLTEKEHQRAEDLRDHYFLCVVSNFRETPAARLWRNPLSSSLEWARKDQTITILSWHSAI